MITPAGTPDMQCYIVLIASVLIQFCFGSVYAWSVFIPPLREVYGLSTTETQIIFGAAVATFAFCFVFSGKLHDRLGPKLAVIIGAVVYMSGYLLASFSGGSFALILLGIGFIAGAGVGFGYLSPIVACMLWFPKQKGMITGLAVAGFGAGAILLSAVAGWALERGVDVLVFWRIVGLVYGISILIMAALLSLPAKVEGATRERVRLRELLRQRAYWGMVSGLFAGTFAGLLVIGNLKPIGLDLGLSQALSTAAVGAFAAGNAAGRIAWGWVFDRLGRFAIPVSLVFLALAVLALQPSARFGIVFAVVAALAGAGFGACFVVYAAQVASVFGAERVSGVYPYIFLAYTVSGTMGPTVGGVLYDRTQSYAIPAMVAVAVAVAGAMATTWLVCLPKRRIAKSS